jgi:glycosyltransferase involved in cell wall biosynthesis
MEPPHSVRRRAVVTSVHPWNGSIQVGPHNLARALARSGWDVLFLADPVSSLHRLAGVFLPRLRSRLAAARQGLARDDTDGVRHLLPFTWLPMSGRFGAQSRFVLDHWPDFTSPPVKTQLAEAGFHRPSLAIVDGAIQASLIGALEPDRMVLRVFDRPSARPGITPALLTREAELARKADLTVVTAATLMPEVEAMGARRPMYLPNGVDVDRFAQKFPEPESLRDIPSPRVVYIGALEGWFDFALVNALAEHLPDFSFVICGPDSASCKLFAPRPNLHRLGAVERTGVPAMLQHASVGIIPFDVSGHRDLVDGVSPIKLYEYLAAGLPVVASRWAEIERIDAPVALADDLAEWIAGIRRAAECGAPAAGLAYARAADWQTTAGKLLSALRL